MGDEDLRKLEREAADGDAAAELRLLVERRRRGLDPVADLTVREPFPVQLPYPTQGDAVRRPYLLHAQEEGVTFFFPELSDDVPWRPNEPVPLTLVHHPTVRSVADAFERWYERFRHMDPAPDDEGAFERSPIGDWRIASFEGYREAGGLRVVAAGSGTVARFDDAPIYGTACLLGLFVISRGGEHGALEVGLPPGFELDAERVRVGPPGAWANDPEIREPGRLPWGDGAPGVSEHPMDEDL
jgi:hypothetical protein